MRRWRSEPFRLFFPLGVVLAWIGIGHWLLYALGLTATYSCLFHGLVQMQAFMVAFACGFLFTALPRRTASEAPQAWELAAVLGALLVVAAAAIGEWWGVVEFAYATVFLVLGRFAVVRLIGQGAARRPPAAFVLLPLAVLEAIAGAGLIGAWASAGAPVWTVGLGRLLVQQGVFLTLTIGAGALILPLVAGRQPPADLGSSPRETRAALGYAFVGVGIAVTLVLEHQGWERGAPLARAGLVAAALVLGGGALQPPAKPGLHRRFIRVAVWCVPAGLALAGLWPAYRVPALHVLFIAGFSLLAFGVATHVALGHLGLERLATGRPRAIAIMGTAFLGATLARLAADMSHTYFLHLGWAAGIWLTGSAVWLAVLGPRLLSPGGIRRPPDGA